MASTETIPRLTKAELTSEHDILLDMIKTEGDTFTQADIDAANELAKENLDQFRVFNRKGTKIAIQESLGSSALPVAEREREKFDAIYLGNNDDSWRNPAN